MPANHSPVFLFLFIIQFQIFFLQKLYPAFKIFAQAISPQASFNK